MKRFIFDSGIANLFISKHPGIRSRSAEEVLRGHRIGVGAPILGELRAGIELSRSLDRNLNELGVAMQSWSIWPFDKSAANEFGLISADLQRRGKMIQDIDMQLAAIAKTLRHCTIVSMDTDFAAIPGLSLENWMSA